MSGSPTMDRDGMRGFFSMLQPPSPTRSRRRRPRRRRRQGGCARSARMTHQGEFMGIAPTGKPVTASGQGIVRVRDGRIVSEEPEVNDALGLMQQLGAVPESWQHTSTGLEGLVVNRGVSSETGIGTALPRGGRRDGVRRRRTGSRGCRTRRGSPPDRGAPTGWECECPVEPQPGGGHASRPQGCEPITPPPPWALLAERPEIQDDEGNDPGQKNRHHHEQDAQDDLPRTRTCPRSQPPDERCHDSDKQSVATASVWADERQDTDERPCYESHSLRRARSWCAPGHRREGFYLRPVRPGPGRATG